MRVVVLGGQKFTVLPILSAWESFALQPLFGPGLIEIFGVISELPKILGAVGGKKDIDALTFDDLLNTDVLQVLPSITSVIGRALSKIPPQDLDTVCKALFANVTVEIAGPEGLKNLKLPDVHAALMRGRTIDTWRLLLACFQENYPDFFALLPVKDAAAGTASSSGASST